MVSNDNLLPKKTRKDPLQQIQAPDEASLGLPQISKEEDIYHVGSLCLAKVIHDKKNPFFPFALTL